MGFTRLNPDASDIKVHESLPDIPTQTGSELKVLWDKPAKYVAEKINDLLTEMESNGAVSGYSGAKNIGVASREEFSDKTNIEDVLVYFRTLIRDATTGTLGDNDIKTNMLNHSSGSEAVDTGAIRNGAITNEKLAGSITNDKIVSLPTTKLTGVITNSQLDGNITYDKLAGSIRASQLYGDIPLNKLSSGYVIPVANGGTGRSAQETVTLDVTFKDGTTGSYTLVKV